MTAPTGLRGLRGLEQLVREARALATTRPMPTLREMSPRFQRLVWLARKERAR